MAFPGSGIFTGMAQTMRNFFAPKVTRQYPEVRPEIADRWRGRLDLIYDPFGEHKCEVCFQCAMVCPVEAIDMSGFDSQGNRIRYGMPEIYDERRDPNAYRRSGLPARPMRNPARWDEAIDTDFVNGVVDGYHARPEALVAIFTAVEARFGYLPERALRLISDRMTIHWASRSRATSSPCAAAPRAATAVAATCSPRSRTSSASELARRPMTAASASRPRPTSGPGASPPRSGSTPSSTDR